MSRSRFAVGSKKYVKPASFLTQMGMTTEETPTEAPEMPKSIKVIPDMSQYAVGKQYDGKLISAHQFGVFVDVGTGLNVLIPRSTLSRTMYEKLSNMVEQKSTEEIKIELTDVDTADGKLAAKYLPANLKDRADISALEGEDIVGKTFKATVISGHKFGVFATLEGYDGIEGLVPASKLPEDVPVEKIQSVFTAGKEIEVKVEDVDIAQNKLTLSMKGAKADVSDFESVPHDEWMQGEVQSVASFGLFVRPVGSTITGLVHISRIPRQLRDILVARSPKPVVAEGEEAPPVMQTIFSTGDVVKMRVHSVSTEQRRLELSMLPYIASADDDDGYIVEGRDPEGEEFDDYGVDGDDDQDDDYDPEDTLLWWRGAPYDKVGSVASQEDEEFAVLRESSELNEGAWRRMFDSDMKQQQADFSSKTQDMELKEIAAEIGDLEGVDLEMEDFNSAMNSAGKFGTFIGMSGLPEEWKKEIAFFEEIETNESKFSGELRAGKKGDESEFNLLLEQVEAELVSAAPPKSKEPVMAAIEEAVAEEENDEAAAEEETASPETEAEAPADA